MNGVSEKSIQENYFNQYRPIIENAAWKASRIFRMDVEDLRAQAYLIFCEAIERYDPSKASFSTHLFNRLRTINDYCVMQKRRIATPLQSINCRYNYNGGYRFAFSSNGNTVDESDNIIDCRSQLFQEAIECLESKCELSQDAQDILSFILGREWEDVEAKVKRVPRYSAVNAIYKKRNWQPSRTKKAWSEIKTWWVSSAIYMEA